MGFSNSGVSRAARGVRNEAQSASASSAFWKRLACERSALARSRTNRRSRRSLPGAGLRHARIHIGVLVVSRQWRLQIQARAAEREVSRRIAALLQVFEMAWAWPVSPRGRPETAATSFCPSTSAFAASKIAAVRLRFACKCRFEIAVGLGAFELHGCLRVRRIRLTLINGLRIISPTHCCQAQAVSAMRFPWKRLATWPRNR